MDAVILFEGILKSSIGAQKLKSFENKLLLNSSRTKTLKTWIGLCVIEGTVLMSAAMVLAWKLNLRADVLLILGAAGFFAPFGFNYLFEDILFEKRKRKKEELLCDLLLEASVFCDNNSMERSIAKMAEHDFPLLRDDFARAYNEIKNGASIEEALERIKELNQSKAYSRVIDLFIQGYLSGAKLSEIMKETAEDLLETKAIIRERQAVMLVTKYTLLLAAGIIVPAVLGLIIGLVSGLNFDSLGELSIGMGVEERKEMLKNAIFGTTVYVFEYAGISSFFLALHEGNKKQFWVYLLFLLPTALTAFSLAQAFY
ncbi:Type II secretion system (T2SS), protein F [uncultured archaeon]|nr:Type II secretion system (T2SS), protein F [uncultured archaeon]